MNNISIFGRLVKDPEIKTYTTKKGDSGACVRFTVAVNRSFGEGSDFFDCILFGEKRAKVVESFFRKGSRIAVNGAMEQNKYQTDQGENRYRWNLNVSDFYFVDTKAESKASEPTGNTEVINGETVDLENAELPF